MPDRPNAKSRSGADVHDYLTAAGESSLRSRLLVWALAVASIVGFTSFWNSRFDGWSHARVRQAVDVVDYYSKKQLPKEADKRKRIENAKLAAEKLEIRDATDAKQYNAEVRRWRLDHFYLIRIPLFGIAVDINELGLLTGLSYSVLLLMLRFSLSREVSNLRILFRLPATEKERADRYLLLAMRQILTLPELPWSEGRAFWHWLLFALILLPLLVHGLVIFQDISTRDTGDLLSPSATRSVFEVELISLGVILFLCWQCEVYNLTLDRIWKTEWKSVRRELQTRFDD